VDKQSKRSRKIPNSAFNSSKRMADSMNSSMNSEYKTDREVDTHSRKANMLENLDKHWKFTQDKKMDEFSNNRDGLS